MRTSYEIPLCVDSTDSLKNYLYLGLHPGGMCYHLLLHDIDGARDRSHVLLREQYTCGDWSGDVVDALYWYMKNRLPEFARGSEEKITKWMEHSGARHCPTDEYKKMVRLGLFKE